MHRTTAVTFRVDAHMPRTLTTDLAAPLTSDQRQYLAERLLEERGRVLRVLNRRLQRPLDDEAGPLHRFSEHMADAGTETMLETLDAVLSTRETHTLGEIDRALRRLYRHPEIFGLDERTGLPIPFARLDIIPWARGAA